MQYIEEVTVNIKLKLRKREINKKEKKINISYLSCIRKYSIQMRNKSSHSSTQVIESQPMHAFANHVV